MPRPSWMPPPDPDYTPGIIPDGHDPLLDDDNLSPRDVEIWRLRTRGISVREIADTFSMTPQNVYKRIQRATELFEIEAAESVIKMELDRLDQLLVKAMDVLNGRHIAYSHGTMMLDEDGNTTADPKPVLDAINSVLKIMDRRSKFLGLDAPTKSEQQINVFKTDTNDIELAAMLNQARAALPNLTPEALTNDTHNPQTLELTADSYWSDVDPALNEQEPA